MVPRVIFRAEVAEEIIECILIRQEQRIISLFVVPEVKGRLGGSTLPRSFLRRLRRRRHGGRARCGGAGRHPVGLFPECPKPGRQGIFFGDGFGGRQVPLSRDVQHTCDNLATEQYERRGRQSEVLLRGVETNTGRFQGIQPVQEASVRAGVRHGSDGFGARRPGGATAGAECAGGGWKG